MTGEHTVIESADEKICRLIVHDEIVVHDGRIGTLCAFINRETGEIREQMVYDLRDCMLPRTVKTIKERMERISRDEQTPRVLLKGARTTHARSRRASSAHDASRLRLWGAQGSARAAPTGARTITTRLLDNRCIMYYITSHHNVGVES
jgi:hypothetical protein